MKQANTLILIRNPSILKCNPNEANPSQTKESAEPAVANKHPAPASSNAKAKYKNKSRAVL